MKRRIFNILAILIGIIIVSSLAIFFVLRVLSTSVVVTQLPTTPIDTIRVPVIRPMYDNIWGTIYHAEVRQCDSTPTITGDGSKINPYKASEHRWIAISQEMLDCEWRVSMMKDSTSTLYKGMIEYGDSVWVASPYEAINGWWIVHDTKNKRYRNSIDFLQTKGDGDLYNNNKYWNGKFEDIMIYRASDIEEYRLINAMT